MPFLLGSSLFPVLQWFAGAKLNQDRGKVRVYCSVAVLAVGGSGSNASASQPDPFLAALYGSAVKKVACVTAARQFLPTGTSRHSPNAIRRLGFPPVGKTGLRTARF